jgi:hypothetical protein
MVMSHKPLHSLYELTPVTKLADSVTGPVDVLPARLANSEREMNMQTSPLELVKHIKNRLREGLRDEYDVKHNELLDFHS